MSGYQKRTAHSRREGTGPEGEVGDNWDKIWEQNMD
jgi:hypothetical protein